MNKEDILTNGEKNIFYILVSICLIGIFIYFIFKLLMRYKLNFN